MFTPTPEELELLAEVLTFAGAQESRILPTEKAIDIFERSGLHRDYLKEIWRFADKDRNGMLTSMELAVALRLIGWVQDKKELDADLINHPGPLPTLEGISDVQRRRGPPVIPSGLSRRWSPVHGRSPSLPFSGPQGHTPTYSSESLPASSTPLMITPPPPPTGRSEPAIPLSPLDNDDLANPIINLPRNTLHTIMSLSSPPHSNRSKRRYQTTDDSRSESIDPVQAPPTPSPDPSPPAVPPLSRSLSPPQLQGSRSNASFLPTPPLTGVLPNGSVTESPAQPDKDETNATTTVTGVQSPSQKAVPVEINVQVEVDQVPLDEPPLEEPSEPTLPEVVVDEVPGPPPEAESIADPAPAQPEDPVHLEADTQEIKRLSELLEASNLRALLLENQLVENEVSTSKLMSASDLELKQLRVQHAEATSRISELESFEKEYRETAALVETLTRDLHELGTEKDDLQKDLRAKLDAKEKEIMDLEKRVSEAAEEGQTLVTQNAIAVQSLTAENLRLTRRLEDREQAFAKEKTVLLKRVQEVEAIAAELQWTDTDPDTGLQQALQDATRRNDALKRQVQELQAKVMQQQQDRGQHEVEMGRMQRRLVSRVPEIQSDPPPPAYDDALLV